MADKYYDHGLYSAPKAGGTAPDSNGAGGYYAEDGNGAAATKASCAVAAITVSDYTQWVAGSDSLSVIGATAITIAAPSSNNDMASKIATAINASTATNANSAVNTKASQLKNLVNAVASGATVTIYSRTGGAEWNSMAVTTTKAAAFSTGFPVTFSGATNGAWGYQTNTAALWPSSVTAFTYGLWCATPYMTGEIAEGDVLHVRPKTIPFTNGSTMMTMSAMGSAMNPVIIDIDDGNTVPEWNSDADYSVNDLQATVNNSGGMFYLTVSATTFVQILGKQSGAAVRTFRMSATAGSSGLAVNRPVALRLQSPSRIDNIDIDASASVLLACIETPSGSYGAGRVSVLNSPRVAHKNNAYFILYVSSTTTNTNIEINNPVFDNNGATVATASAINVTPVHQNYLRLRAPKFVNFVTGSGLLATSANSAFNLDITEPDFGNVTVRGPVMAAYALSGYDPAQGRVVVSSSLAGREFMVDTSRGYVDWNPARSYPTLSAQLPDSTLWSWRVVPPLTSGNAITSSPFTLPKIAAVNSNADGARTVKVYFGIEKSLAWTKKEVSILVQYVDVNDNVVIIDSFDYAGGALTTDTSTWSVEGSGADAGRIKWDNSGSIYFNKFRIELSTPTGKNMKAGCEVAVFFRVHSHVAATDKMLFVDPEPVIV